MRNLKRWLIVSAFLFSSSFANPYSDVRLEIISKIKNYQERILQLQERLNQTSSKDEILKIRQQINQLKGKIKKLKKQLKEYEEAIPATG